MLDRYILRYRYYCIVVLTVICIFAYHTLAYSNPLDDLLIFPGIESRQMSMQIKSNPYNPELYYKLGQAYANRGWDKKTAQYLSKWLQLSNSSIVNDGTNTFVLDEKNDRLLVLNSRNNKLIKKIDVGWLPKCLIPTPDKKHLYVPNALSNSVSNINTQSLLLEKNIKVGKLPWNGKISPGGDQLYVTNLKSDNISVINTKTNSVIENIAVGNGPWCVAVSPNGKKLYVSNQESRNIQVVDTGNYNIIDVIALEIVPGEIALAPEDEKKLYALNSSITGENLEIYVLDLSENRVANSMKVPGEGDQFLSKINAESIIKQLRESKKNIPVPEIVDSKHDTKFQKSSLTEYEGSPQGFMSVGGPEIIAKEMAVSIQAKIPVSINDKTKPDPKKMIKNPGDGILKIVIVVKNDTLWSITKDNYGKASKEMLKAIQEFNPEINDTDKIYVGQKIKLPDMEDKIITKKHEIKSKSEQKAVTVKPNDNLFRIVLNNYGTVSQKLYDAIMKANPHIISITIIKVGQKITLPDIQTRGPA